MGLLGPEALQSQKSDDEMDKKGVLGLLAEIAKKDPERARQTAVILGVPADQWAGQKPPNEAKPFGQGGLGAIYDAARSVERGPTGLGMLAGGAANYGRKLATGEEMGPMDYIGAAADLTPPGVDDLLVKSIPALGMMGATKTLKDLTGKAASKADNWRRAAQRRQAAQEVLRNPIEWQEPSSNIWLADRNLIRDAMEGHPGVEQISIERRRPTPKANLAAAQIPWENEANLGLIRQQVERGRGGGGEAWYQSTYPLRALFEESNSPFTFDDFAWANALTSGQSPVAVNIPTATAAMALHQRGLPMNNQGLAILREEMRRKYGVNPPGWLATDQNLANFEEYMRTGIPPSGFDSSQKVAAYGQGLRGNVQGGVPMDTHELAGTTYGSPLYPYYKGEKFVSPPQYQYFEDAYRDLLQGMDLTPASGQASRWIGGGELTDLKTGPGDFLSIAENLARHKAGMTGEISRRHALDQLVRGFRGDEPLFSVFPTKTRPSALDLLDPGLYR
jgi:hypothetical protein